MENIFLRWPVGMCTKHRSKLVCDGGNKTATCMSRRVTGEL